MTRRGSAPPLLGALAVSAFLVLPGVLLFPGASASDQEVLPLITEAEYERWRVEFSNWGRWGPDDELGALNLITPAKRLAATALVRAGITVSLASTAQTERTIDNPCPLEWEMANATRVALPTGSPIGASTALARRTSTASPIASSTAGCGTATRWTTWSRWKTVR